VVGDQIDPATCRQRTADFEQGTILGLVGPAIGQRDIRSRSFANALFPMLAPAVGRDACFSSAATASRNHARSFGFVWRCQSARRAT
jgi:hypothetical protein